MTPEETEIRARMAEAQAHAIPAARLAEHYIADVDALLRRAARAEGTVEDWARSVLYAASGLVCTPEEGFVKAPHTLHRTVYDLRDACKTAQAEARQNADRIADLERALAVCAAVLAVAEKGSTDGD